MKEAKNAIYYLKILWLYLIPFVTAYFGYHFAMRRIRREKRLEFLARQLEEFYSPMVGYLKEIKSKGNVRLEISEISDTTWREICARQPQPFTDHDKYFESFKKEIDYNNKQLQEEVIPRYDKMLSIFNEKMGLANPTTKKWYDKFSRFVEIWHRWLDNSIPREVVEKLHHTEEEIKPFYEDLEIQLEALQKELLIKKS